MAQDDIHSKLAVTPIILCGGSGLRLWPLSRGDFPKQFVPLIDGQSLLDLTLKRVGKLNAPILVANEKHRFFINEILINNYPEVSATILLEPAIRNTAAAMASTLFMPKVSPTDILLFLPSDHFIPDTDEFISTIQSGIDAAKDGYIVTFGVVPTFPSTAYGYIRRGQSLGLKKETPSNIYNVSNFVEKPDVTRAQEIFLSGAYFWNSGIFLCKASVLKRAFSLHANDILESCYDAMKMPSIDGSFVRPIDKYFLSCRSESIDFAVLEKFDTMAVVPFKGVWSDVGSWNALSSLMPKDEAGNYVSGQGVLLDSRDTHISASQRLVVALGTKDLIIVDTQDAVLVASTEKVEKVKDIVIRLKEDGVSQAVTNRKVMRPWGWYDTIDNGLCFKVKRILVRPGASLSLQLHKHRAEHWVVVKGRARVTKGREIFFLEKNQSTYIPVGMKHRLENPTNEDLEMIEVQSGSEVSEEDIVRFEDAYGRK